MDKNLDKIEFWQIRNGGEKLEKMRIWKKWEFEKKIDKKFDIIENWGKNENWKKIEN